MQFDQHQIAVTPFLPEFGVLFGIFVYAYIVCPSSRVSLFLFGNFYI